MAALSSDVSSPPWDDLPAEMVDAVVERLDVLSATRLAAVCSSWAAAVATNPALPFGTPCLLMASEELDIYEEDTFELLDLTHAGEGGWAPDPLPALMRGQEWVGCKDDWLATVDKHGDARLVNPYTGQRVELPDISAVVSGDKTRATFIRIVVCETPSSGTGAAGYLVVAVVGKGVLAIARGGDDGWTALKNPVDGNQFYCSDVVVHKGKVVAVDFYGVVHSWNIEHACASDAEPELKPPPPPHDDELDGFEFRWRLAESADGCRLLLVRIYGNRTDPNPRAYGHRMYLYSDSYHAEGVRLYERDVDDAAGGDGWSPVVSLGDHSLFPGVNYPFLARVVDRYEPGAYWVQLRPNCVCVTYNHSSIWSELFDCDMQLNLQKKN
ncbi:hypothetical protein EJB05_30809, partial [Eragrostis curvula]